MLITRRQDWLKFKRYKGECEIFNLLGISWIVDPQDRDTYNAIGSKSYDTISTDLAASGTDTVRSEYKTEPSPGLSSVSVSEHNKARTRKGDIGEDAELQRALKLSEAEISGRQGALIRKFVKANSSQLTVHGLSHLQEEVKEDELCVFFRNNHFSTMFKHGGKLYLLATDEGFLNQPNLVWEKLDDVKGNTKYMTGSFNEFKAEEDHGYLASAYDDSSYKELTITLQEAST
ncbi:hypothetical protein POM88_018843 [Heracleum sosnowskyi]|uniref:MINDY deubiquitinase domain-containing protein n=1 Tax=Heracleum sosnowskyi TaxID=360622 RepID=A0AAD8IRU2_9APIA|nr:hypothetical protein POM88_018843 [Heracleum sosnowskyi]